MTEQSEINYEIIKASAKELGVKVNEYLALTPANDPFYVGTPSDIKRGEWFKVQWDRYGFVDGVHIRRVHYALQATGDIRLPVQVGWSDPDLGKQYTDVYINNHACWNFLVGASKMARYLGLVDSAAFVDRLHPDAIINDPVPDPDEFGYSDPAPGKKIEAGWTVKSDPAEDWWQDDNELFALPSLPELDDLPPHLPDAPKLVAQGYTGTPQKYLLYIFAEKTTMDDVIGPLCEKYHVNYKRGKGELSITTVVEYLNDVAAHGRPSRILYISDYDPAGVGMPISVSRKIEFYLSLLRDEGHDIALKPIVLTQEQIARYNLPSAPVKTSDKRKANFERDFGLAVELDALEALHPGELSGIVEREILQYYDTDYLNKLWNARRELQLLLNVETRRVVAEHDESGKLADLRDEYYEVHERWQEIRDDFDSLVSKFQINIEDFRLELEDIAERTSEAHEDIRDDLRRVRVEYPDVPDPNLADEHDNELLFDSRRSYMDQLEYYKNHRSGG